MEKSNIQNFTNVAFFLEMTVLVHVAFYNFIIRIVLKYCKDEWSDECIVGFCNYIL